VLEGFGVAAIGMLAAAMFRSDFGTRFNTFFSFAPAVAYILAALIWLTAFRGNDATQDSAGKGPPLTPEEMRAELRRYRDFARRLGKK
jgi:hypothetical protein